MEKRKDARKEEEAIKKRRIKKIIGIVMLVVIVMTTMFSVAYAQFRKTHFGVNQTISGVNVSLLTSKEAYSKISKINHPVQVTVHTQNGAVTFETPLPYAFDEQWLKGQLSKVGTVPYNPNFKQDLQNQLATHDFQENKGKDAYIKFAADGYQIVPEVPSTVIDKEKLLEAIEANVKKSTNPMVLKAEDFYIPVKTTAEDPSLTAELSKLNEKIDKQITLDINTQKYVIPRTAIAAMLDEERELKDNAVYKYVSTTLNNKFSTLKKSVYWKNPTDGKTYEYLNNGAYGWDINFDDATKKITDALNSDQMSTTLKLKIDGNKDQNPRDIKDYVYINLIKQMEYIYRNNKLVLKTRIISGRNNKGTATVPGFHTIGYKDLNAHLKGQGLDGKKYDVPVTYWEPLLSRGENGPYYTGIGMHDSNNKDLGFQDVNAWQTLLGSNGCINNPPSVMPKVFKNTFVGMPVIIRGDLYADSPGVYDKPVDLGKLVKK